MADQKTYAFRTRLDVPFEEALERVTAALKSEGFGILTSVDMQATLREKLGAEFRQYRILGACNPPLAQQALSHDVEAGLVLPCTVIVYEEAGGAEVAIADPMAVVSLLANPAVLPMAREAHDKLKRVLGVLQEGTGSG